MADNLLDIITATAAERWDAYGRGPEPWYVVLPSRYEQRGTEVIEAYQRIYESGWWPAGLVGVEFAAGRKDPRVPQLRRITFTFLREDDH